MKKCPVCSREYRDVVSLCPFDGAGLAPAAASVPEVAPPLDAEIIAEPLANDTPTEQLNLADIYEEPAPLVTEIMTEDDAETEVIVAPPRVAAPTTLLTEPPPMRDRDEAATFIRAPITIPLEEDAPIPVPTVNDYLPNAANAASLPHTDEYAESNRAGYGNAPPPFGLPQPEAYDESNRAGYGNVPPVIPPMSVRPPVPPARDANPWRWATFGLAGMILVFAGAWFFLGGSRPGSNANDPMAVDPNAASVNPAPPILGNESGLPPPDANFNSANFNSLPLPPPAPGAGTGPNFGGSTGPFPTGPPPSLSNINQYPPPVINSNAPNANVPNFNSGGIKAQPTPLATPKAGATPKPLATPAVAPTPSGTVKPAATPGPAATPKPSVKPAATPKPAGTPGAPEPLQ